MVQEEKLAAALESGRQKAKEILERRAQARARRAAALKANSKKMALRIQPLTSAAELMASPATLETAGYLAAVGDSWFDYPLHDVLKLLDDGYGYNIESTAHKGDPIEKMSYAGGQLDDLGSKLDKIKDRGVVPKAVLVSGGGDDIAGNEFGMLINNKNSPIAGWDEEIVNGVIQDRLFTAYSHMLTVITLLCQDRFQKTIPILVHGYDYPVPDGRGFLGGWPFPGPWLEPGFREKSFDFSTMGIQMTQMMENIIDRFNVMVGSLNTVADLAHVRFVDLRRTLSNQLSGDIYKASWANELHPTEPGFEAVTKKFADALAKLP